MRLSYFHGFRRRWLCSRCETRQTCKSHLVLRAVSPPWHVLVWILPLIYEVSSIILVFTLMLMFMYRVYQKKWLPSRQTRSPIEIAEYRWILSMSAAFWEICWSLSFWVQFSFVFGGVVRVLIFCIGQLVIWVGRHAKAQKLALDDFTKIKFGKFILPKVDYWSLGQ